jgi:hypothetical protein
MAFKGFAWWLKVMTHGEETPRDWRSSFGTPTKRQVSKRQVSKRPVSKRLERQVY